VVTSVLPKVETEATSQQYGRYIVGPLERGYGVTLGNALRRMLLSSLSGAAVTSIRVLDVAHEFTTIPHVREDMIRIILGVKKLRLKMNGDGPMRMVLRTKGEGVVTAGDIKAPPEIEILNPDLYLFSTDSDKAQVEMEFNVERGRGYSAAEERGRLPVGEIAVDAIFSPVRKVAFDVEQVRVGQITDYDRLTMEIWTDGRVRPMDALKVAARILVTHFRLIAGITEEELLEVEEEEEEEEGIPEPVYNTPIDELGLGVRVFNALRRAGISKIGEVLDLLAEGDDAVLRIRNIGEKSLVELKEQLEETGYIDYLEPVEAQEED
jgi:DNA-directed RNA polymerase subunit alpha